MHVHVYGADGEAKIWLEPTVELAQRYRFPKRDVTAILKIVVENQDELRNAWRDFFER
jgi:hypothetical protein